MDGIFVFYLARGIGRNREKFSELVDGRSDMNRRGKYISLFRRQNTVIGEKERRKEMNNSDRRIC